MDRNILLRIWHSLYRYRLFRWLLWSVIGIVVADQIILAVIQRFQLLPQELSVDMFPHQDVPAGQLGILEDLHYASQTLRDTVAPILLPENSGADKLEHYSALLRFIETASGVSWLALKEADVRNTLKVIAGVPTEREKPFREKYAAIYPAAGLSLTEAEATLRDKYKLYERASKASAHVEDLIYTAKAEPDSWLPAYVESFAPPSSDIEDPPSRLELTGEQRADAEKRMAELMDSRDTAIRILRKYPPTPMGFAPATPEAFGRTRQADINSGNLLGNPDWKPLWRDWKMESTWNHIEEDEAEQVALGRKKPTTDEDVRETGRKWQEKQDRLEAFVKEERARQEAAGTFVKQDEVQS